MNIKPYVIPAREQVEYPLTRVSLLSITQDGFGKPLICNIRIARGRVLPDGTYENAPPESEVAFSDQISIVELQTDSPNVAAAMYVVNEYAAEVGVKKGALEQVSPPPPSPPVVPPPPAS